MALWSLFQSAIKASKWPLIKRKWGAPHVVHPPRYLCNKQLFTTAILCKDVLRHALRR